MKRISYRRSVILVSKERCLFSFSFPMFHTMFHRKLSHWSPTLDINKHLSNIDDELVYMNLASLDYVCCGGISLQGGCFPKINFIFSLST